MLAAKLFADGLPIALGIVMIGAGAVNVAGPASIRKSFARWGYPAGFHRITGGLEIAAGLLLLIPATSRLGAAASAIILAAAVATVIRHRDWGHLPAAAVLAAAAIAAIAIHG
ncbi:DoxX family protein [Beijerinckia sp. L45]|uniref:DoxX family protein n=1 Tax=Beijerinckia sp. L45 TaxID=1641855 RepID=UPI00131DABE0|nr:DoxX family protein [Beijerinckia sp. L45]